MNKSPEGLAVATGLTEWPYRGKGSGEGGPMSGVRGCEGESTGDEGGRS